jgi:dCTP deaminase
MLSSERISALLKEAEEDPTKGLGCCPNPIKICDDQIGAASLDVRLGSWFLVLQQSRKSQIDLTQSSNTGMEETDGKYYYVPTGEKFVLHPGRFVLGSTLEWMRFPKNIGGMITGKSTLGRRGLIIETASGIQPSFTGCLTLEIFNCGEVPIAISPGMRIAHIFFHEISGEIGMKNSKFSGRRKPIFGNYEADNLALLNKQNKFKV